MAGEIIRGVKGRPCVFLPTGGRGAEGREGAESGDERQGMRVECLAGGEVMGRWGCLGRRTVSFHGWR